ncbi:MAG: S16 family serine protease, partial [bacterium]|nr:S16 family serine protease [bacterium]
ENKKDLEDIPNNVLKDLRFVFVQNVDEVLKEALIFSDSKHQFPSHPKDEYSTVKKRGAALN